MGIFSGKDDRPLPDLAVSKLLTEVGPHLLGWRWRYVMVRDLGEANGFNLNDVDDWVEGRDDVPHFVLQYLHRGVRAASEGMAAVGRVCDAAVREIASYGEILDFGDAGEDGKEFMVAAE